MKKEIFEVVGVKIYESDLSKEALKRIKKEILNNWETRTEEEKVTAVKSQLMTGKDLKEMILQEEKGYCVSDTVVMEIINDEKFEMDDEIWQNLSKSSSSWAIREVAAKSSFPTADKLKAMLLLELKTYCDPDVIIAIINNKRTKMDENIWKEILMAEKNIREENQRYIKLYTSQNSQLQKI